MSTPTARPVTTTFPSASSELRRLGALALLGGGVVALSFWLERVFGAGDPSRLPAGLIGAIGAAMFVLYGLAAALVRLRPPPARAAVWLVLVVALVARLALAFGPPVISSDVYRYVWDGRVQAHGINPYRYPPDAGALVPLRDRTVYPQIDRKSAPTIYAPVAQGVFRAVYAVHRDSVVWTKIASSLVDVASVALLALLLVRFGSRPERSLLYAWHPLAIVEVGSSGHVDAVAVPFLLLAVLAAARKRDSLSGVLLAGAALVKLYALVALPALVRRGRLRLVGALAGSVVLAYLPFLGVGRKVLGYLPGYVNEEGIASGRRFYLLRLLGHWVPVAAYQVLVVAVLAGIALVFYRRPPREPREPATRALLLFVVALVLTTPAYPWYGLLALALVPLARGLVLVPAAYVLATSALLYVSLEVPSHPRWPEHVAYGGSAIVLALTAAWAAAGALARARASRPRTAPPRETRAVPALAPSRRTRDARLPTGTHR